MNNWAYDKSFKMVLSILLESQLNEVLRIMEGIFHRGCNNLLELTDFFRVK